MEITFIAHSCFAVATQNALIVFDYWHDGEVVRLQDLVAKHAGKRHYFVVSHFHEDHYNEAILRFGDARFLLSYDTVKRRRIDRTVPTAILRPGDTYSDECLQLKACRSTDVGISTLVALPDGTTVYHAGDNNNWYFPDDGREHIHCTLREMEGLFAASLNDVYETTRTVDHAMFPIDPRLGDNALRGIRQWLKKIPTRWLYPMHCWERWSEVRELCTRLQNDFPGTHIKKL